MTIQGGRWIIATVGLVALAGCVDEAPTSSDPRLVPIEAATFEISLPFDDFATDFQLCCSPRIGGYRGFGSAALLEEVVLAGQWGGDLDVRSFIRFPVLPKALEIFLEGTDLPVYDTLYTVDHGTVVLRLDPLQFEGDPPFEITVSETLSNWHVASASWDFAVDTLGNQTLWPQPGGGPSRVLGTVLWDPTSEADTVAFDVDLETMNRWSDLSRADRGIVVSIAGPDTRLVLTEAWLVAWVESSFEPEALNSSKIVGPQVTMAFNPNPEPSVEAFQIGGTPSRRAAFRVELPETIDPPESVCEIVQCPIDLRAGNVVYAALQLRTRETVPRGLAPRASIVIEPRTLLAPERFPRSPLGFDSNLTSASLDHEFFSTQTETLAEFSVTSYIRTLLLEPAEGSAGAPSTLTLRTNPEPAGLGFATFWGPGTELEPTLRLVLTVSGEVTPP